MATKKSEPKKDLQSENAEALIEERRARKLEATTVDGTESFPPPGMDLPGGGVVPLEEGPEEVKA